MLKRLIKLKYTILFFLVIQISIIGAIILNADVEKKIYLKNKTELSQVEFKTIYAKTKEQSEMIFQELINTPEIISIFAKAFSANKEEKIKIRKKLYEKLLPSYTRFKKLINLKQVHFHLENNHSFLRLHKVNKFGDDLTEIRPTVAYVNKYKKSIDGFEEGRVYNGFRFVYPLFDEKQVYLGSVEVSFSAISFQKILSSDVRFSQFIFSKKIIDEKVWEVENKLHYKVTRISPDFLVDVDSLQDRFHAIKLEVMKNMSQEIKDTFIKNTLTQNAHSIPIKMDGSTMVLSFLPIKNPISKKLVAYLVVLSPTDYLDRLHFKNTLLIFISIAFLMSLFIIIYGQRKYQDALQEQKNLLLEQSKMAQMGSMLSNIAHQWKQPLARINSKIIEIPLSMQLTQKESENLDIHLQDIENLTLYMASTIENFRTYFNTHKEHSYFLPNHTIDKAISLLDIDTKKIYLNCNYSEDIKIKAYEDELIQVIMILLVNAQEAFENSSIENAFININIFKQIKGIKIVISDNAGGIEEDVSREIFNPYFSTKENNSIGRGLGLYMAKMIIEFSMKGKLFYKRKKEESHFCIELYGEDNE